MDCTFTFSFDRLYSPELIAKCTVNEITALKQLVVAVNAINAAGVDIRIWSCTESDVKIHDGLCVARTAIQRLLSTIVETANLRGGV